MRACSLFALLFLVAACEEPAATHFTDGGAETPAEVGQTYRFTFDDAGPAPADFITVLGDWSVTGDHALQQRGAYATGDFPRIIVKDLTFEDFTLSVRCRPEAGEVDQACGVMFHLEDSDNYLLTRANALEGNVRLYRVVDGDRQQFASADASITSDAWHTLSVVARGERITVRWDDVDMITETDTTFARGKIGLWTKADSVTSFDDLEVTAE